MAKGKGERKGGSGGGGGSHEEDQEQKLQAILLADSFNTNFRPISNEMPKVNILCFLAGIDGLCVLCFMRNRHQDAVNRPDLRTSHCI